MADILSLPALDDPIYSTRDLIRNRFLAFAEEFDDILNRIRTRLDERYRDWIAVVEFSQYTRDQQQPWIYKYGLLWHHTRLFIPRDTYLRRFFIGHIHFDNHGETLHRSEAETTRLVARHFCWADLSDDVNQYIFQCTCQHHQPTPNNTVHHYLAPPIEIPEDHVTAHTLNSYYDDSDSYGYHSGTD